LDGPFNDPLYDLLWNRLHRFPALDCAEAEDLFDFAKRLFEHAAVRAELDGAVSDLKNAILAKSLVALLEDLPMGTISARPGAAVALLPNGGLPFVRRYLRRNLLAPFQCRMSGQASCVQSKIGFGADINLQQLADVAHAQVVVSEPIEVRGVCDGCKQNVLSSDEG
jgi:hypothetical protein